MTKAAPVLASAASGSVPLGRRWPDVATLSGAPKPTGTITFKLYALGDATCSHPAVFTTTVTIDKNAGCNSGLFAPAKAGTYRFTAAYSGDANNAPASEACGATGEQVTVTLGNGRAASTGGSTIVIGSRRSCRARFASTTSDAQSLVLYARPPVIAGLCSRVKQARVSAETPGEATRAAAHQQPSLSTAADYCFARPGGTELMIELATKQAPRSARVGASTDDRFRPNPSAPVRRNFCLLAHSADGTRLALFVQWAGGTFRNLCLRTPGALQPADVHVTCGSHQRSELVAGEHMMNTIVALGLERRPPVAPAHGR